MKNAGAISWAGADAGEAALVERCVARDQAACAELVAAHQRMVYALAFHLLGDRDDALDVSQEVFLRVFRTLPSFRGQSALRTWIFRIVINQARNRQRWWNRRRRGSQVSLDEHISLCGDMPSQGEVLPDRLLASKETATLIWRALDRLPFDQKTAIDPARGRRAALRRDRVLARHRGRHREVAAHPRAAGAARRAAGAEVMIRYVGCDYARPRLDALRRRRAADGRSGAGRDAPALVPRRAPPGSRTCRSSAPRCA